MLIAQWPKMRNKLENNRRYTEKNSDPMVPKIGDSIRHAVIPEQRGHTAMSEVLQVSKSRSQGWNISRHNKICNQDAYLASEVETSSGALLCNLKTLYHRGRLPINEARLPLVSTDRNIQFVSFKLYPSQNLLDIATSLNPQQQIPVSLLCFDRLDSIMPIVEIPLTKAVLVVRTCSEIGPCLYLSTVCGVFEFQCKANGTYSYEFWETQMKYLGVRLVQPSDLFTTTSGHPIGEGSFAKVYTAAHCPSGECVIVKKVPKEKLSNLPESHLSAVHIEIEVLRKIRHPFIIQFMTAFEDDFNYYLIIEKLSGGTINEWLRHHKRMTEQQARGAMIRVLSALAELEKQNVVHRDLKLENLVLENSADPTSLKLIDFGLAAYLGSPRMAMHCGSPGFVAPEIINKEVYGREVDMFSAGVLLYAFLSGKTPFHNEGDTASETLCKNRACNVNFEDPIWKKISAEAKHFLNLLLTKSPSKRLSPLKGLSHPWITQKADFSCVNDIKLLEETSAEKKFSPSFKKVDSQVLHLEEGTSAADSALASTPSARYVQNIPTLGQFTSGNQLSVNYGNLKDPVSDDILSDVGFRTNAIVSRMMLLNPCFD